MNIFYYLSGQIIWECMFPHTTLEWRISLHVKYITLNNMIYQKLISSKYLFKSLQICKENAVKWLVDPRKATDKTNDLIK